MVRGSSQVSCAKASPGTCEKLARDWRAPASSRTTFMPRRVSSWASVPPPAPEPMMTTAPESSCAMRATASPHYLLYDARSSGAWNRATILERHLGQPVQIVEPAQQVATFGEGLALVAEVGIGNRRRIERAESLDSHGLEERRGFDGFQGLYARSL